MRQVAPAIDPDLVHHGNFDWLGSAAGQTSASKTNAKSQGRSKRGHHWKLSIWHVCNPTRHPRTRSCATKPSLFTAHQNQRPAVTLLRAVTGFRQVPQAALVAQKLTQPSSEVHDGELYITLASTSVQ